MKCEFTVQVYKENGTWRMVRCPKEAAARILDDCFSIVAHRCMEHAEWTVANVPARLSLELIEDSEGEA